MTMDHRAPGDRRLLSSNRLEQADPGNAQELAKNPEATKLAEPFIDLPPVSKRKKPRRSRSFSSRCRESNRSGNRTSSLPFSLRLAWDSPGPVPGQPVRSLRNRPVPQPSSRWRGGILQPCSRWWRQASFWPCRRRQHQKRKRALWPNLLGSARLSEKPPLVPWLGADGKRTQYRGASQDGNCTRRGGASKLQARGVHVQPALFRDQVPGLLPSGSPSDPDLVLVIRSPKEEHVAKRISRITSNEMHVQLLRGNSEASISFADITEIHVRHKDGK